MLSSSGSAIYLARTIVGILANVTTFILFISPTPTFIRIWKKGSVEQFSPDPYLVKFINCLFWVLYGLPMVTPNSILVVTVNGTGVLIEIVFIALFILYSDARSKRLKVLVVALLELAFVAIYAVLVLTLAHSCKLRSGLVGPMCILFSIMTYASPLSIMKMVIRTKSVEYMPFFLSLAAFANGACWVCYAAFDFDLFIMIPNGFGALLGAFQLILYATYYKSTMKQLAEREPLLTEVGEARIVIG